MAHSSRNKNPLTNRRGFSAVVGTIFMVLAVLFLYFNVYTFTQNQNTQFQDIISQSQQLDADRNTEHITIETANYTVLSQGHISLTVRFTNDSPLPVQIARVWAEDNANPSHISSLPLTLVMSSGNQKTQIFDLNMGATISGSLHVWFATSRGNLFAYVIT